MLTISGCIIMDAKNLRDRDGVPDLRRSARFRYASITLPEVVTLTTRIQFVVLTFEF